MYLYVCSLYTFVFLIFFSNFCKYRKRELTSLSFKQSFSLYTCMCMFVAGACSYLGANLLSPPGLAADERRRAELDWLTALCQWRYSVHTAQQAYSVFTHADQVRTCTRTRMVLVLVWYLYSCGTYADWIFTRLCSNMLIECTVLPICNSLHT